MLHRPLPGTTIFLRLFSFFRSFEAFPFPILRRSLTDFEGSCFSKSLLFRERLGNFGPAVESRVIKEISFAAAP